MSSLSYFKSNNDYFGYVTGSSAGLGVFCISLLPHFFSYELKMFE